MALYFKAVLNDHYSQTRSSVFAQESRFGFVVQNLNSFFVRTSQLSLNRKTDVSSQALDSKFRGGGGGGEAFALPA